MLKYWLRQLLLQIQTYEAFTRTVHPIQTSSPWSWWRLVATLCFFTSLGASWVIMTHKRILSGSENCSFMEMLFSFHLRNVASIILDYICTMNILIISSLKWIGPKHWLTTSFPPTECCQLPEKLLKPVLGAHHTWYAFCLLRELQLFWQNVVIMVQRLSSIDIKYQKLRTDIY